MTAEGRHRQSADVRSTVESRVSYYNGRWPCVFERGQGSYVFDERGREYLDFFCGAGSLNYGHNDERLIAAMVAYLRNGGILNSLDAQTVARRDLLTIFRDLILIPRDMNYRLQFTSPSGSDCVEAALRLARKYTRRSLVAALSGSFHGETLGSLAVSDRVVEGVPRAGPSDVVRVQHEHDVGPEAALLALETAFRYPLAALIVEVVQGEGGCRSSSAPFLTRARELCDMTGTLLIIDDVQAGCGRTGPFLSFESVGIEPDLICLSKSLSGSGLPMSLLLIRPEIDVWHAGEFSGTFRGSDLAFVTAATALSTWWCDYNFQRVIERKSAALRHGLESIAAGIGDPSAVRGDGLMLGLSVPPSVDANAVASAAFNLGLLVETCGRAGEVVKVMPPLTLSDEDASKGVALLRQAFAIAVDRNQRSTANLPDSDQSATAPRAL